MRLLLDQGLPRSAADRLRAAGHDAVHTGEIGYATASDEAILARALAEGRIVATLDADFHALLAWSQATAPSVIRIRIEGLRGPEAAVLLVAVISKCSDELDAGAAVSVDHQRIRIKRLPLVG